MVNRLDKVHSLRNLLSCMIHRTHSPCFTVINHHQALLGHYKPALLAIGTPPFYPIIITITNHYLQLSTTSTKHDWSPTNCGWCHQFFTTQILIHPPLLGSRDPPMSLSQAFLLFFIFEYSLRIYHRGCSRAQVERHWSCMACARFPGKSRRAEMMKSLMNGG